MKAMILAAGLGTRLLPYTLKRPKPLFPVLNKPLLHLTLSRIRKAGFSETIVNCHHLHQQIKKALRHEKDCLLQEEKNILGTGGGLRKAMVHFNRDPVLVVNGDIYHTINYREVYQAHCASSADVTLVLHDYPRFNNVAVDDTRMIIGFNRSQAADDEKLLAFTGIHVINPGVLEIISPGTPSCIIDCYRKLLDRGGTIRAHIAENHFWTDMGTPEDYLKLHGDLLKKKIPAYEELSEALAEAPFVGMQRASLNRDVQLLDWACLGQGSVIETGVIIERAVVWDGSTITAGSIIQDAIVTD
jgi:mannose-1-phosphate guanylyltransferase